MTTPKVRKPLSGRRLRGAILELTDLLARGGDGAEGPTGRLGEAASLLLELFACEAVEVRCARGIGVRRNSAEDGSLVRYPPKNADASWIAALDRSGGCSSHHGVLVVDDLRACIAPLSGKSVEGPDPSWGSLVVAPFSSRGEGLLMLAGRGRGWFGRSELPFLSEMAMILGIRVSIHPLPGALEERVKELQCLYGISRLVQKPDLPLHELLQGVVELVPPAWQYPEYAQCRITFDGDVFESAAFRGTPLSQSAGILVNGAFRGRIEVHYREDAPGMDPGAPFLPEERNLIEGLAREVSLVIERRQLERDRERLWEQLRHMDRLATLGQLAASVAHELNEPLCAILGLAQLALKDQELSPQTEGDLRKILASSLHAREIVKGLLGFSRVKPASKATVSLNRVLGDALDLIRARCVRAKVVIQTELALDLPDILADSSQIQQVLMNLVANAIQAMPEGGRLLLETRRERDRVVLVVEDTGQGMDDATLQKIFVPFFTTKEVGHGTGLGLGIVHGIVAAHGGTISVESRIGAGTRFTLDFPARDGESG